MRHIWLLAHLVGFVMWLGAAAAAMAMGIAGRREAREHLGVVARQQAVVYRAVMMPGVLLTVASGLVLTLMVYGGPGTAATVSPALMAMQATGLAGAVVVLVFGIPAVSRVGSLDPVRDGPLFDRLRRKASRLGMASATLGMAALVSGAWMRP